MEIRCIEAIELWRSASRDDARHLSHVMTLDCLGGVVDTSMSGCQAPISRDELTYPGSAFPPKLRSIVKPHNFLLPPSSIHTFAVPMYSDDSRYHPHDVLILKHFPYEDIAALEHENQYHVVLSNAQDLEAFASPPPEVPWPLPPLRPADQLGPSIKSWKLEAQRLINERVAAYTPGAAAPQTHAYEEKDSLSDSGASSVQRTFRIAELLEHILRYASPTSQLNALRVSVSWRSMVQHIIGQSHRTPYPCLPVDHGQLLDPSLNWLRSTQSKLWDTDALVATLPSMDSSEALRHFVLARLTQCQGLNPQSTSILLHL
jgi:hypothetical protein